MTIDARARERRRVRLAMIAIAFASSVLFGYVAVRGAEWHRTWLAFADARPAWIVPVLGVLAAAFLLRALRWWALFDEDRRPPFGDVVRALFVGYLFNALLPLRAGEPARIIALNRRGGVPIAEATGTALVERVFDVLSLLLLLVVFLPWLPSVSWTGSALVLMSVIAGALGVAVVALSRFGGRLRALAVRALALLPWVSEHQSTRILDQALEGLAGLRRAKVGLVAFALTTTSWLVTGFGFWLLLYAFDVRASPLAGMLVVIAIGLALVIPSPPAALGVFEGAAVIALDAYGVEASRALSYALALHAINVVPFLLLAPLVASGYWRHTRNAELRLTTMALGSTQQAARRVE